MSIGTDIIETALSYINAHSVVFPANPESVERGWKTLNAMLAEMQDEGIKTGAVPLKAPGSEFSEPLGTRNGFEMNLAIMLLPFFPGKQVSSEFRAEAFKQMQSIRNKWKQVIIPKKQVSETLPVGQGNKSHLGRNFFVEGSGIG